MRIFVTNLLRRYSTFLLLGCLLVLVSATALGGNLRVHSTRSVNHTDTAYISGYVYSDLNYNGIRDDGDTLVAYQIVGLHATADYAHDMDEWTNTDNSGYYFFQIPDTGVYTVGIDPGDFAIQTYPTGGQPYTIHVDDSVGSISDLNLGAFYQTLPHTPHSRIGGIFFNDENRNGIQDGAEAGLPGILVSISGEQTDTTRTDSTGHFIFSEILDGHYDVFTELLPGFWTAHDILPYRSVGVLPDSGVDSMTFPLYTIVGSHAGGTVFNDLNRNGVRDPGENGLAGWTLQLTGTDDYGQSRTLTDISGNDGSFSFDSLWPSLDRQYVILQTAQSKWIQTQPSGFLGRKFYLGAEATMSGLDFGNHIDSTFNTAYRSFIQESISYAYDKNGVKWGPTKGYPIGADFIAVFVNTTGSAADGLTAHFLYPLAETLTCVTPAVQTLSSDMLTATFAFVNPVAAGDTVIVTGRSYIRGKFTEALSPNPTWSVTGSDVDASARLTVLGKRYMQPNTADLMLAMNAPLRVGVGGPHTIYMKKYGDVGKSMYEPKLHVTQSGPAACLDGYRKTPGGTFYSFKKQGSYYPIKYQSNILFGEATALQLNITASDRALTPRGFGDLIFDEGGSNPFNGNSIRFIAAKLDTFMSSYKDGPPAVPCAMPAGYESVTPGEFWRVIRLIDSSFSGPMDYLTYIPKPLTMYLNATRSVDAVPYLHIDTTLWTSGALYATSSTPESHLPFEFALHQNFPNPFNPSTRISFVLPTESRVTLKVFNLLGQEVATALENEDMTEGKQEVTFDASRLASGVYFYRINARSIDESGTPGRLYTDLKKMVLLK